MHSTTTMKHGSHHLRESIAEHLHSSHFWTGVVVALLFIAFVTALIILSMNAPLYLHEMPPYVPYM